MSCTNKREQEGPIFVDKPINKTLGAGTVPLYWGSPLLVDVKVKGTRENQSCETLGAAQISVSASSRQMVC